MSISKFGKLESKERVEQVTTTVSLDKSRDLLLNIGNDETRVLGCDDLTDGKQFTLKLGDDDTFLSYEKGRALVLAANKAIVIADYNERRGRVEPVFKFNVNGANFLEADLRCRDRHTIKELKEPTENSDAATKQYVDERTVPSVQQATGILPGPFVNIVLASGNEKPPVFVSMFVEKMSGELIHVLCTEFQDSFKHFSLFIKDNTLYCRYSRRVNERQWTENYTLNYIA